jgi:hypothetical protein
VRLAKVARPGLVAVVIFIAYIVSQFVAGVDLNEFVNVLVAMDHANFLLVMTSLIFAMLARGSDVKDRSAMVIYLGLLIGTIGFVTGLVLDLAILKRIFTPILGLALLHGIFTYLRAPERTT